MLRLPALQLLRPGRAQSSRASAWRLHSQFRSSGSKVPEEPKGSAEAVKLYLEPTNFVDVATTPLRHLSHSVAINVGFRLSGTGTSSPTALSKQQQQSTASLVSKISVRFEAL